MRLCSGAGCGRKIEEGARFCDECQAERGAPQQTNGSRTHTTAYDAVLDKLRKGGRWQRIREKAIRKCPMCAKCGIRVSEIVDHIVPAAIAVMQAKMSGKYPLDPYAGYYLMSNLQGLCRECHYTKTIKDKAHAGPWPNVVAIEAAVPRKVWVF